MVAYLLSAGNLPPLLFLGEGDGATFYKVLKVFKVVKVIRDIKGFKDLND